VDVAESRTAAQSRRHSRHVLHPNSSVQRRDNCRMKNGDARQANHGLQRLALQRVEFQISLLRQSSRPLYHQDVFDEAKIMHDIGI
jgi:hypothetical protein